MSSQPINLLFRFLQNNSQITVNLFYKKKKIKGKLIGFDEFMNVVLEEAFEILQDSKEKKIGKVLIRGDSVILIYQTLFKK